MRTFLIGIMASAGVAACALAQEQAPGVDLSEGVAAAARQPGTDAAPDPQASSPASGAGIEGGAGAGGAPGFGETGSSFFSIAAGYMNDFEDNQAGALTLGYSRFIADELEFNLELSGWYFSQEGDDTGALSPFMNFRWHFWHDEAWDWSVFAEAGFGLLFAFDNVPDGGTGFNFLPRAGLGFTKRLDEDGTRLMLGVRWQHISNGRIEGDERNPSRDSIMGWAGVMFPF